MPYRTFTSMIFLVLLAVAVEAAPAQTEDGLLWLREGWRFSLDMQGQPAEPAFNDSAWRTVALPNNAKDVSDELPRSVRPVWFRKRFQFPGIPGGSRVILRVDAVRSADAWLNGQPAGKASGGDSVLQHDITGLLRAGENVLAVRTPVPGIGGGVRLFTLPPVHIGPDGLLLDTPGWQGGPAVVRARVRLGNHTARAEKAVVAVVLSGPDGREVTRWRSAVEEIAAGQERWIELRSAAVLSPPLWSPDMPLLCSVTAELQAGGRIVHRQSSGFGFRWFRFDPEKGFFLNGQPFKLRGTVYTKTAVGPFADRAALWKNEIGLLKGMGIRFVRPAEGGIAESFLGECDRAGLLAMAQVDDEGALHNPEANVTRALWRNYNHPSLITWQFNGEGKSAEVARQQSLTARIIRSIDPLRPVTCVELGWRSPGTVGLVDVDVAGQGNYTGWYEGTLEHIGPYMDSYRELLQERYGRQLPVFVSNYGAAADSSVHTDNPRRNDFSAEYFTEFHRRFERELTARPWMAGGLIFTFRDIQSGQPIPRHTWKGVIDLQERKRDAYYFYQSVWTEEPMVRIAQQDWTPRDVWPPARTTWIEVFSNCDRVELIHDSKSLGARTRTEGFRWEARLAAGSNALKAIGRKGTVSVEDAATVVVRHRPPAPEAKLVSQGRQAMLQWNAIPGIREYSVFGSSQAGFEISDRTLLMNSSETSLAVQPKAEGFRYRVAARHEGALGTPSSEVGRAPGALQWRFVNSGWLLSSPALADLDADGRLDIVVGSYNNRVYALRADGSMLWEFDTGDPVFSSAAVAPLARGEAPAVAIASSRALFVLSHRGELRWKHEGLRQFDRNPKSPAIGDLDSDGRAEVVAASDTGAVLAFSADGRLLWRHDTAGPQNAGLCVSSPVLADLADGRKGIAVGADDGLLRLIDPAGRLIWKREFGRSETLVGPVPGALTPAAARFADSGSLQILTGAGHLRALNIKGDLLWERKDVSGMPSVALVGTAQAPGIAIAQGPRLRVLDQQGKDVWEHRLERFQDFFTHSPVVADLDSAGGPDLVAGSRATTVYAFSGQGRILWTFRTDDELSSSPAVADLDGDGFSEVVIASRDGCLYVVGGGVVQPDALRSLQYRAGPSRSGENRR